MDRLSEDPEAARCRFYFAVVLARSVRGTLWPSIAPQIASAYDVPS
jgi:hypothetical protein